MRLRLLLDTVVDGAQGLRRELALPPVSDGARPADLVGEDLAGSGAAAADVRARALAEDEPGRLDQLLGLPQVHLVIDGYNVTKTGYGSLPLDGQRQRLLTRLGALAAQTGAEVTVVFDGAALDGRRRPARPGRADDLQPGRDDRRHGDPAAGPRRAARTCRWSWCPATVRWPTVSGRPAPGRCRPRPCCAASTAPDTPCSPV